MDTPTRHVDTPPSMDAPPVTMETEHPTVTAVKDAGVPPHSPDEGQYQDFVDILLVHCQVLYLVLEI